MSVLVLMSVYNGEKYLRQQLDSILIQDYTPLSVLVRDDGSTDGSVSVLKQYAEAYENVKWYAASNCGAWKSFMDLVQNAGTDYDYYAFADQDDVWLSNKILVAAGKLQDMESEEGKEIPLLYSSNITPVNENLEIMNTGIDLTNYQTSFGSALVQGITSGLTCVFNKAALLKMREAKPEFMIMHDWWLYLVASCYGKVYYDSNSYVLYRQHRDNVCGARTSKAERVKYRLTHFSERSRSVPRQIQEFIRCYDDIPPENLRLAQLAADAGKNYWKRICFAAEKKIHRQRKTDNLLYKVLVLFGYM